MCPSEFEKHKKVDKNENERTRNKRQAKGHKNEKQAKEPETSKGGGGKQTKLMNAWTLLREFFGVASRQVVERT
jgi:hypothetical protein